MKIPSYSGTSQRGHTRLNYLLDFMETTTRIAGQTGDLTSSDEFVIQNQEIISRLINEQKDFLNRLSYRVVALNEFMSEEGMTPPHQVKRWIYNGNCLVIDFTCDGMSSALDVCVTPGGWELHFFNRQKTPSAYLCDLCSQPSIAERVANFTFKNGRYSGNLSSLKTTSPEIASNIQEWVIAVSDAITSQKSNTPQAHSVDSI